MTQIKVNVGIDEDLRMILEMDPSLMDDGVGASSVNVVECPKVIKLPPKMYVYSFHQFSVACKNEFQVFATRKIIFENII